MQKHKILRADHMERCIGCYGCMLACARTVHHDFSIDKSAIRIRSSGGLQGRFIADLCRGCDHPACVEVCPTAALKPREGGGVLYQAKDCIGCRQCVQACIVHGIQFDEGQKKAIVCIQCGTCTRHCPHGVLRMEGKEDVESSMDTSVMD